MVLWARILGAEWKESFFCRDMGFLYQNFRISSCMARCMSQTDKSPPPTHRCTRWPIFTHWSSTKIEPWPPFSDMKIAWREGREIFFSPHQSVTRDIPDGEEGYSIDGAREGPVMLQNLVAASHGRTVESCEAGTVNSPSGEKTTARHHFRIILERW